MAWRDLISEWTPTHLRIMATLGCNVLAIQEDLVGSLLREGSKLKEGRLEEVLQMLTMFDVLSIQVVYGLIDLEQMHGSMIAKGKLHPLAAIKVLSKK